MKIDDSIITIKPTTTHIINLNNYTYKQLQKIHDEIYEDCVEVEFDAGSTINTLIHRYNVMKVMLEEGLSFHDAVNKVLFGQTTLEKEDTME